MGFRRNLGTALIVAWLAGAATIAPSFASGRAPSFQAAPPAAEDLSTPEAASTPEAEPTPEAASTPEAAPARVAHCEKGGEGFDDWLAGFKREAANKGISSSVIESALADVAYDDLVVSRDRGQGVFRQSFEQFSGRMISAYRLKKGRSLLKRYADVFRAIEQRYGPPGPVLVAIWGLETDFGAGTGDFQTLNALATLAYDCRRAEHFREELLDALKIVQRGDLEPAQMHGAWAGEIGQTQFMPSSYLKYAVAFDGRGPADLINQPADALASTANFLRGHGWRRGAGWDEEQPNFAVLLEWNRARVYAKTLALFADKLASAPESEDEPQPN
jgi:lytic murein transglycosylase